MGSDYSCVISDEMNSEDETPTIKSPFASEFARERLMSRFPDLPNIGTIYDLFQHTLLLAPDSDYYGHRVYQDGHWLDRFEFVSRRQIGDWRDSIGAFLIQERVPVGSNIGILSYNRIEWIVVQQACFAYGFIPVPIYDTFGWENINFIINHSKLTHIFVVSSKLQQLLDQLDTNSSVQCIIVWDNEEKPYIENTIDASKCPLFNRGLRIVKYNSLLSISQRYNHRPPKPDTPAAIMYTSGTTGFPKGCIITHSNFIATASCFHTMVYPFTSSDTMLSYLPLAHVYEAVIHIVGMKILGARIAFYSGSISRMIDEIKIWKPTVFTGVTRVFERVYDGIQQELSKQPLIVRGLFNTCFSIKSALSQYCRIRHVPILDKAFSKIQDAMGGNVRLFIAGGAPMKPELQNFMRIACNCMFIQGYGLTESTAGTAVQICTDLRNDNIGVLLPCTEAKLKSVPELGYSAKNLQGELYVKGTSVFKGYYQNEEATRAVLDQNGWFKTGDIFALTPTRQLTIVGRVKELVKLSQGEYISIPKLLQIYGNAKGIQQVYIHAGKFSRYLSAIVLPENPSATEESIIESFNVAANEEHLNGFERIKFVKLISEPFTTENGLLTPSLKLCNFKICQKYAKEIAELERKSM